jgi:hypothetical protein
LLRFKDFPQAAAKIKITKILSLLMVKLQI